MKRYLLSKSAVVEELDYIWYANNGKSSYKINATMAQILLEFQLPNEVATIVEKILQPENKEEKIQSIAFIDTFLTEMRKIGVIVLDTDQDLQKPKPVLKVGNVYRNFEVLEMIAANDSFVQVYKILKSENIKPTVIKLFACKKNKIDNNKKTHKSFMMFQQEMQIHRSIPSHPNICFFVEKNQILNYPYFEMEFVNGKELSRNIRSKRNYQNTNHKIASGLLAAMAHLHHNNIVHADLHSRNFMFDAKKNVKIIDFGFSYNTTIPTENQVMNRGGVAHYMPPERVYDHPFIFSNTVSTLQGEVYQLGLMLFRLYTKTNPFASKTEKTWAEMAHDILNFEILDPITNNNQKDAIIKKAMSKNPIDRYKNCVEMQKMWLEIKD